MSKLPHTKGVPVTDLSGLWRQRLSRHGLLIGKYARLILNDHFSIIMVMVLAFALLYYRDLLVTLEAMDLGRLREPILWSASLILGSLILAGRPLWLTQAPDRSYLFAQGRAWQSYWLKGSLIGAIPSTIVLGLVAMILFPMIRWVSEWQGGLTYLVVLFLAKYTVVGLSYLKIFKPLHAKEPLWLTGPGGKVFRWGLTVLSVYLSLRLPLPWHYLLPAGLLLVLWIYLAYQMTQRHRRWIQFDDVVESERGREGRFYRWVSIFADVPQLKPAVKRRSYLDPLIRAVGFAQTDRYAYLYLRALMRNTAYSGIWQRVTFFVAVLMAATSSFYLLLGLGVLGLVLTLVQLMPLAQHYQHHPLQQLYPNRTHSRLQSLTKTLAVIVAVEVLFYAGMAYWRLADLKLVGLAVAAWLLFAALFLGLYLPWRSRRKQATPST